MKTNELKKLVDFMGQVKIEMEENTILATPCSPENLMQEIANKIKKTREEKKMTKKALAGKSGNNIMIMTRAESGKDNLTIKTLSEIANGLDCNVIIEFIPK